MLTSLWEPCVSCNKTESRSITLLYLCLYHISKLVVYYHFYVFVSLHLHLYFLQGDMFKK